jgi:ribonuclease HII
MSDFLNEKELINSGYKYIAGVDEVGRGPLAGPVVAAAVILPMDSTLFSELDDSKKLGEKKREKLQQIILSNCIAHSVAFVDNQQIEEINILQASIAAMRIAVSQLSIVPDYLLIDGNRFHQKEIVFTSGKYPSIPSSQISYKTIIKGDQLSYSISAASILAKIQRDI